MDWDRIDGNWKQFTGKVEECGKPTDDDIAQHALVEGECHVRSAD